MKRYDIPATQQCSQLTVKRSRFIANLSSATNRGEALIFIDQIVQQHPKANHNCWAFQCSYPGCQALIGFSDDGEPHGSAGRAMLNLLLHTNCGEIVAVVSRYFGGLKLGYGNLMRTYTAVLQQALVQLPLKLQLDQRCATIILAYQQQSLCRQLLSACEAIIVDEKFNLQLSYLIKVPSDRYCELQQRLAALGIALAIA